MTASESVERFLASGEFDPRFSGWDGDAVQRRKKGDAQLRHILQSIVAWRAEHAPLPAQSAPPDATDRVRTRITPMLRGLFTRPDADLLIEALPERLTVVTVDGYPALAQRLPLSLLWRLANLLLDDLGAPPLSDDLPQLEGFCDGGRAWVLPRAFGRQHPAARVPDFSDTIVHEVAHLLHELRRSELGLLPGRRHILTVPPQQRETFAWTCEIWACISRQPDRLQDRLATFHRTARLVDPRVDRQVLMAALQSAAEAPADAWARIRDHTLRVTLAAG